MTVSAMMWGPRLLVRELGEIEERTPTGLVVPITALTGQRPIVKRGVVVEVGFFHGEWDNDAGDHKHNRLPFEKGEVVVWHPASSLEIQLDLAEGGVYETFWIVTAKDVLLKLEDVSSPALTGQTTEPHS